MGKVILSPNPVKTKERIDFNGNIIDPQSKRVIVPKEPDYIPPPPPITQPNAPESPITSPVAKDDPMDIQAQIEQTEANLVKLKEAKMAKIKEMEELLNKLKNQ